MWYSLADCLIVFVYVDQRRQVNLFKRTKVVIYYLLDNSWLSYMCLYHLQDKTKNLKTVYLIQTNKKQIQGHTMYVNQIPNQRDDMLTKTRN